jgi:Leucine-rich repeat (LRR) protein
MGHLRWKLDNCASQFGDQHTRSMNLRRLAPRFGMRTLLVGMTCLSILFGWGAYVVRGVRQTQRIADRLEATGAVVGFEGCSILGVAIDENRIPDWAWELCGEAAFSEVTYVWLDGYGEEEPDEEHIAMLAKLTNLEYVSFDSMTLPTNAIAVLAELPRLRSLSFDEVEINDDRLRGLASAPKLEELDLGDSPFYYEGAFISDETLSGVSDIGNLRVLKLSCCGGISAKGYQHLTKLPSLRELSIQGSGIRFADDQFRDDVLLRDLPNHAHLEILNLNNLAISDSGCRSISQLRKLRELSLDYCEIGDATLIHLRPLESLTLLSLYNTTVSDAGIAELLRFSDLRHLSLSRTQVTNEGVRQLVALKHLEELRVPWKGDLSACEEIKRRLPGCTVYAVNSRGHATEVTLPVPTGTSPTQVKAP